MNTWSLVTTDPSVSFWQYHKLQKKIIIKIIIFEILLISHYIICNLAFENVIPLKLQIVFFWIIRLNWRLKGGVVVAVFLDLKKAFDTVNHEILIEKLSKLNFSPNVIKWT